MTVEDAEDAYVKAYGKWQAEEWHEPPRLADRSLRYKLFGNLFQAEFDAAADALEKARREEEAKT